jgi:hypothetical protein
MDYRWPFEVKAEMNRRQSPLRLRPGSADGTPLWPSVRPPPRNSWKSQKADAYFRDEFQEGIETFAEQAEKDGLTPTVLEGYRK